MNTPTVERCRKCFAEPRKAVKTGEELLLWGAPAVGGKDIGIKHRRSFRVNYEIPFGKSRSRMKQLAIGGWQANLLAFYQSGIPFTPQRAPAVVIPLHPGAARYYREREVSR